jgi:branched-chain amino acid aminotransferase
MSQRIVYLNGRFVPESQARLSIYDSALTMGDMAFEVTRTFHGRPFRLRQHLERLFHSLAAIRINLGMTIEDIEQLTEQTLALNRPTEPADADWNIIHNVSRGPAPAFLDAFAPDEIRPTVVISCYPLAARMAALAALYDRGLDLVVPPQPAIERDRLDPSIKTRSRIHYHMASYQAAQMRPGAWAVLATRAGELTEGTSGNLFLAQAGRLLTPPAVDVLPGITRAVIIELAGRLGIACRECPLRISDAEAAEEIFLTSTSIGLLHARTFNGRTIGKGAIGPIASRLRSALNEEVGLDFGAQARHWARRVAQQAGA